MTEFERIVELFGETRSLSSVGKANRLRALAKKIPWLFVLVVILPSLVASTYYFFIASPIYVSEAHFVVRSRSQPQAGILGAALQSVGIGLGQDDTAAFEVHEYMQSRDAVADLVRSHQLREVLARPGADFMARYPRLFQVDNFENLYETYKRFVTVAVDGTTRISVLRVEAFRAKDARAVADALMADGERLVNQLNERSAADTLSQANLQMQEAEAQALRAQRAVTAFRNRERMVDPDKSSIADLQLVTTLQGQLDTMRAERSSLAASAPQSPQLPAIDKRIAAFAAQIELERSRTAGEANSLAPKLGEYEQRIMERDFAVKSLAAAEASLENARVEIRRKQIYLERVVNPSLPDKAVRPRRLFAVFMVVVSSMIGYGIISLIIAGLREHQQKAS